MLVYFLIGATYGFAAAVQPGPLQTYLISQTLTVGWKRTVPATFSPLISDIPIATLVLLILSQVPRWFEHVLHIGGGIFVLYLAYGAFRAWRAFERLSITEPPDLAKRSVWKATLVNLLNPNPYIGWSLVMGPLLLKGWHESPTNGIVLLGSFYATMVACTIGIVFLFAFARRLGPQVDRFMLGVSAFTLAGFGLYQLWLGIAAYF